MATQTGDTDSSDVPMAAAGTRQPDSSSAENRPQRAARRRNSPSESAATPDRSTHGEVSNETRYVMIQEAAYLRAERRNFAPGFELGDWLAAENEIDSLLGARRSSEPQ